MSEYFTQDILILISILLTEFVFLKFYISQKPLPINSNRIVFRMFKAATVLTLSDLVATFCLETNVLYTESLAVYIVISIYYIMYQLLYTHILEYVFIKCHKHKKLALMQKYEPAFITLFSGILMMNYFYGNIFYLMGDAVYAEGLYFIILHILPIIILISSLMRVLKEQFIGIFYALAILFFGTIMQFVINDLALEVSLILSVILLYITTESPAFFESEGIKGVYNTQAFIKLTNEYLAKDKEFYVYGIHIHNFDSLKNRYGARDCFLGLECFSQWLKGFTDNGYLFYTFNDTFNYVTTEPIDVENVEEYLMERMKKSFKYDHIEMYIWAKLLSVTTDSQYCKDGSDIINAETVALKRYSEKHTIILVDREIYEQLDYNSKIEKIIQECIEDKQVEIYIQPLYNSVSQKIEGGEVLTRIKHEELGLIMPDDFIGLAEKNGSIFELSNIIFEKTCDYISRHDLASMGIKFINVNCSPVQFQNINLVEELKGIADRYEVDFSIFDFEVTESNMNSENLLHMHIAKMKEYGATASLDDFGTGSSDVFRLVNYDFSLAKLDKSLVWNYFDDKSSIMVDIINMFKHENLKIVAEGIETEEMVRELSLLGCEYLQGYYFSKPIPAEEFLEFVKEFNN
ncbi:EAL domain, c-di-GMP-specific phosphodiesterase class I (or its enzymatically inactive variant) [Granulicatella balaenopterae]|uniref:EAL domain, c-di-GMP-specific phosphodiesterase class I (Or its enzymatically inactive variant) n=1 Tax=Granulicatella balaenopterae TaxID=137733 RepID=A0A1H9ISM9_9LACT|nr:EAL domain-containing protein [Granulicatella balaenopterae]SEQ77603.1 EAL domain, c-di-GMP-specific phosphodiesterase class I (or its enzymatically inactive variant) [Granulicatella balaenopterae]